MLNGVTDLPPCLEGRNRKKTENDVKEEEKLDPLSASPLICGDLQMAHIRACTAKHVRSLQPRPIQGFK
jgi:hypothetical protein